MANVRFIRGRGRVMIAVIILSCGSVVTASVGAALARYSSTPGAVGLTPTRYPGSTPLPTFSGPRLLMFAHPLCPCTRASLRELDQLTRQIDRDATVVFFQPQSSSLTAGDCERWRESDLIRFVESAPHLSVHLDVDGVLTEQFAAQTSGLCLVYDAAGRLVFRGGITPGRGHQGPHHGQRRIRAAMLNGDPSRVGESIEQSEVFGCEIL